MSKEATTEASPAAVVGNPSLLPETNQNISSMADAFKQAMGSETAAAPDESAPPPPADPPPEEAAVESPPEEAAADTKKESRSAKDFKLIKQERDEARRQTEEMSAKLAELEDQSSRMEEYDRLKAEYDELSQLVSVSNLERHPKFQKQFVEPINAQIERVSAYVPEESRRELVGILKMPASPKRADALDALTADLPASRQAYIQSAVSRIDEIAHDRDAQLESSRESYQKMIAEEQAGTEAQQAKRSKALESSFSEMLKQAQENIPIYQSREGDDEWNAGVRERVNLARKILMEQNSFEDAATAALWAASGGALVEQNAGLVEHNRRLQSEINKLKGAEPSATGAVSGEDPKPVQNSSFSDKVLGELRDLGLRGAR